MKWQADMAKQARKLLNKGDLTAQERAESIPAHAVSRTEGCQRARRASRGLNMRRKIVGRVSNLWCLQYG